MKFLFLKKATKKKQKKNSLPLPKSLKACKQERKKSAQGKCTNPLLIFPLCKRATVSPCIGMTTSLVFVRTFCLLIFIVVSIPTISTCVYIVVGFRYPFELLTFTFDLTFVGFYPLLTIPFLLVGSLAFHNPNLPPTSF